ncbi:tetratricopeptide repeat-containing protein EMW1 Ecym_2033 [Eremothecium cymbalariae DBVPG|uniref:Uncharacterized protein n=1 Tax=Eremothecium cymbalariae (strain CBS 270.75 / DBVPG 7215 / KCTC 17166 / NRRL Y-17582) TaxID=931890 RepID=G8JNZ1_ERECY|nr:Hypothetical protein Ecym_2033 [Eremothecium cymbalariae DBVPG\
MSGFNVLLHSHLLLASESEVLRGFHAEYNEGILDRCKDILNGQSHRVISSCIRSKEVVLDGVDDSSSLLSVLALFVRRLIDDSYEDTLILGIALLQTFIQNNYTGPEVSIDSKDVVFNLKLNDDITQLHEWLINLLAVSGQPAYELCADPVYLVLSLLIFELLTDQPSLFLAEEFEPSLALFSDSENSPLLAVSHWWRGRALLVQLSLVPEAKGPQSAVVSSILSSVDLVRAVVRGLPEATADDHKKKLYTIYYLENVKCSLALGTEFHCPPCLIKVQKMTNFQLILTGARTKRTKFQEKAHSGLIILARSASEAELENHYPENQIPEELTLNSELLLEKPYFESIGEEPLDEQIIKKQKLDGIDGLQDDKLLPIAIRQENIPICLSEIDPNNQPTLTPYDNIQLLLRLYTIKQTTPAGDALVEQELFALLSRIIHQDGPKNWGIFSRALWERSILETSKAKTIERGILQMQSLVEELGFKIKHRITPEADAEESAPSRSRLLYIHQLPFVPRWQLDSKLAEKYMSMGILKSAVEIYERLHLWCDAALCYAAVGDDKRAEQILLQRIQSSPKDARAYSILGDIRQDPSLWEKSWELGRYVNAKNSLGRFYYNPPSGSGFAKNNNLALKHLNDSLRLHPLSFNTWYFYGCIGLESAKMELAAEAFSRCVSLDETHALSWSNLSAAYTELGKFKEAHSCLKRAVSSDAQSNWRIWENYMLVSAKIDQWDDVLVACKRLVQIKRDKTGEGSIDIPIVEKLTNILISTDFPSNESQKLTHFQNSCMEFICCTLPSVITTSARCWRLVSRVELWRKRPHSSLECYEKAYRTVAHNPDIEVNKVAWENAVEACEDLVASYESLGQMEGKHGAGDIVCKDWRYKARSVIKSLMNKGRSSWEDSEGWQRLLKLRDNL